MVEVAVKSPVTLPDGGQDDGHDKEAILNHSGFDTDDTVDSKAQAEQSNSGALVMIAGCNGVRTYVTTAFLKGPGFRWGYGVFCIITPAFMLPLFDLFMYYYCKAKRMELVPKRESNREWRGPIYHYAREFDAVGLLLVTVGISLVLLSFNIYSYQKGKWKAPIILYFFIFGGLLIIAFALWEKFFALVKFLPYHLLTDRTAIGSSVLAGAIYLHHFAGNTLVIYEQTAAIASVEHQFVDVALAIQYMFSSIGGGIGLSITAAIWQGVFSEGLSKGLPESAQANLTKIYESLPQQLSRPWGSPDINIQKSYALAQKTMLIADTAISAVAVISMLVWRDYGVKERTQVRGRVS
ncbi:hypothetical protein CDV31_005865 [Fusarium ambrosium]|uniref:Siderophore iron transporter mirB n=1 Tax=Fusarium ambrosium TaxID=131363 RepID=A0A428UGM8_9HYPO|nr:hypothetical protein CDV31_005865 [Fusarium ambrosium]